MVKIAKGVRQINEHLLQKGRAIILTDEDFENYDWNTLPDGTLHIDTKTGVIMVKLKGESTWVPCGIKNDGTLVIARDSKFIEEAFTILTTDNGDGTFTYVNDQGQQRKKPLTQVGFVFELDKGSYLMGRGYLEVYIDNILYRSVLNGGLTEISERKFRVNEKLTEGQVVNVKYIEWLRIGNPYPRFFLNDEEPEGAEIGDIWIDPNGTEGIPEENLPTEGENTKISWANIVNTPISLAGYGITDKISREGHVHKVSDITDFPKTIKADGGNSDTVGNKKPGKNAGDLVTLNDTGKIDLDLIPDEINKKKINIIIGEERPSNAEENTLWFCTSNKFAHIECYTPQGWIPFGAVWK